MSYFLTDQKLSTGQITELSGEEARHILLARRMKKREQFNLQDILEKRYLVEIIEISRNSLKLKIIENTSVPPEPEVKINLFQSVVNEKALDFIFQKATELGANKIVLFNSQNTATKLSVDTFKKKQDRWTKILWESAKQSDRVHPPALEYLKSLDEVVVAVKDLDNIYLADVLGKNLKSEILNLKSQPSRYGLLVGPEGGFAPLELEKLKTLQNCLPISLGPTTLRAETAAIAGLAVLRSFE